MTYEYHTFSVSDIVSLQRTLAELGQHGWELMALVDRPMVWYAVLKRPVAQPDPPRVVARAAGRKKAIVK